jgi:hypothetical protein
MWNISLARFLIAQLFSQSIHVFGHEVLLRRLSSPSLDIPPRSIRAVIMRRICI